MPIADLLSNLEREGEAEIRVLLAAAEAEVARIEAESARSRAHRLTASGKVVQAEHQAAADLEIAAATRRAREDVLTARAGVLSRVLAVTRDLLPALVAEHGERLAPNLIAAALACTGCEPGVVRCAPSIVACARAAAPPNLRVEPDLLIATGVVIELDRGTRIEASLDALLDREWPRLAPRVLEAVASEGYAS